MLRRILPSFAVLSFVLPIACVSEDPGLVLPPVTCDAYCSTVQASCTGVNAQYRNTDECLKVCASLDLGKPEDGNVATVGCRLNKAKTANDKTTCAAAGPWGGDVCGDHCVAYCTIANKECISDPAIASELRPFASIGDCTEACPSFRVDPPEDGPPNASLGPDTFNCRARHLIIAIDTPDPHCSHAAVVSALCKDE